MKDRDEETLKDSTVCLLLFIISLRHLSRFLIKLMLPIVGERRKDVEECATSLASRIAFN